MESKLVKKLMSMFASNREEQEENEETPIVEEELVHNAINGASIKALTLSATTESKVQGVKMSFAYSGGQEMIFDIDVHGDGIIECQTSVIQNKIGKEKYKLEYVDTYGDNMGESIAQTIN